MVKKTVWANKITGEVYGEDKQKVITTIIFSMPFEEKMALIKKEYSLDKVLGRLRYPTRISIDDIVKPLIENYYLESKEVKIKCKWIEDETGREFFSKEQLYQVIQEEYLDDGNFIGELINEEYTPLQIYDAIKEKGIEGFEEEITKKSREEIIERWFSCVEVEEE